MNLTQGAKYFSLEVALIWLLCPVTLHISSRNEDFTDVAVEEGGLLESSLGCFAALHGKPVLSGGLKLALLIFLLVRNENVDSQQKDGEKTLSEM